ncbi:MAG TPA: hypothetical protein VGM41_13585 [Chitinophagaceae bacterium]|jgi:hypothetical protein
MRIFTGTMPEGASDSFIPHQYGLADGVDEFLVFYKIRFPTAFSTADNGGFSFLTKALLMEE